MRYAIGDVVAATRRLEGTDVPVVPAGTVGTVVKTTVFGRAKQVTFTVDDGWGTKRFSVVVTPADVELYSRKSFATKQD